MNKYPTVKPEIFHMWVYPYDASHASRGVSKQLDAHIS